ncbi:hypothetical protein I580_02707 [Enterococcus caccae ATCC BAA-1240]|uniref:Uncharacterized protein n=1 Tax=Enterococcus caccae ATCC BAA-1240 TaxID=1158612 RepID=R3TU76_9ENTE|nr:hypothetical protein UC7_01935 [Enterococcus caccae ATCC BAA-1240]EOT58536.1 hypothetical protein I580_02707 [Enterococcus caccae ATCC BAA-1240]
MWKVYLFLIFLVLLIIGLIFLVNKKIKNKTQKKIIIFVIIVASLLVISGILPILRYAYLTN